MSQSEEMGSRSQTMADEEFLVQHNGLTYEISKFLRFHPGGRNTVQSFKDKDITDKLKNMHHAPSAFHLMKEYELDKQREQQLETMVDWSRAMLWQVGKLGENYQEWVSAPVDRKLRLFQSDTLEALTVTPWYLVPIVWIPVILFLVIKSVYWGDYSAGGTLLSIQLASVFFSGVVLWSLLEYSIHRWVFHLKPPAKSPYIITFHFLMHGLHHKVPFDERRLLFPPVPAAIIASLVYVLYLTIFPTWSVDILAAGTVAGYVTYDLTHYYLHHGSPNPHTYFYYMKRYHNQHHFTHHETGFGISSSFWDRVFGTKIILRKLTRSLRW